MARPRLDRPNFRLGQRGDRFYVTWWADGRKQRVSTGTADKQAALRFLAQFAAGFGTPAPPETPTIGAILDGYLADRKGHVAAFATLEYACAALRRHLGDLEPDHLTTERVRFYRQRRRAEGAPAPGGKRRPLSDGTVIRELVTLRAALRWAVKERWIAAEPTIQTPTAPPPRDRWLTRDEAGRLLAGARQTHVRTFLSLALYTVARSGALLGLTWDRVDFRGGIVDLGRGTGNKGRAVVPMTPELRKALRAARSLATSDYVVEHGGDKVGSIKTGFAAAARRAGLTEVTPHTLRHTGATWMAQAGVPLWQIAGFLGNSVEMVERVYGHHHPDHLKAAAAALSGPLAQKTRARKS